MIVELTKEEAAWIRKKCRVQILFQMGNWQTYKKTRDEMDVPRIEALLTKVGKE